MLTPVSASVWLWGLHRIYVASGRSKAVELREFRHLPPQTSHDISSFLSYKIFWIHCVSVLPDTMADPLSVTASAASVVSLADILLRTGKEVYTFFRAVKNASKDVQSIIFELQQYEGTLMSIKKYVDSFNNSLFATNDRLSASGLLTNLQHCEAEFRVLKDIVEDSRRKRELGSIHKFASKVKWVFDEKKIAQCCQKLENVKSLLNTELSLAGRKDIRYSSHIRA